MDLQDAMERFLAEAGRHRSAVTVRRYEEAMDLLLSFLALERLDPDDPNAEGSVSVEDVTPEAVQRFVQGFLVERFGSKERAYRRYVAATRALISWLERSGCVPQSRGEAMRDALAAAARRTSAGSSGQEDGEEVRLLWEGSGWEPIDEGESIYQVLEVDPAQDRALLVEVISGREVTGAPLPEGEAILPGDLMAGRPNGARVGALRLIAPMEDLEDDHSMEFDEEGDEEEEMSLLESGPVAEYAMEILSSEDRYAPREVVETVLANIEDVEDELMEWLLDEEYRNEPLPGTGEAPANAARILSEVRHLEAVPRLLSVLGDRDPLGEEAPAALGRYGVQVLGRLQEIAEDREAAEPRRAGAAWALAFVAARNPAWRREVSQILVGVLRDAPAAVQQEVIETLEALRSVEALDAVSRLVREGNLDLESFGRTLPLLQSRIRSEGLGDRLAEGMLPIVFLYPTSDELEAFYESAEEDLGESWEDLKLDDHEDEETDVDSGKGDAGGPEGSSGSNGGKVLPFRRPTR